MYSLSQVRKGIRRGLDTPALFGREANRLYHRRLYNRQYNTAGVDVPAADWDTLLILDACRYDVFAERHSLPGTLRRRQSRGSHTIEFMRANFGDETHEDIVYVTASPMLYQFYDRIRAEFHAVDNVWDEEGWDDRYNTVLPETTTAHARAAHERHPNKRVVVHYVQPHYPFLDADDDLNVRGFGESEGGLDVWGELMRGDLDASRADVWRAYRRNLDAVLDSVSELLPEIEGKTVVTSDHGNMIGERASPVPVVEWGHPPSLYTPELVDVPWLVYEQGERRRIVAEAAEEASTAVDSGTVDDRLRQLGYV